MEKGERVIRVEVRLYATLKKYHPSTSSGHRPEGKNSEPGERRVERLAEIMEQEFQVADAASQGGLT